MKLAEMKEKVLEILNNAEDVTNKDAVLGEMFSAGIPFAKLNSLYQSVGIEAGLIVDPTKVKEAILNQLEESELDIFETWNQVEAVAGEIAGEIQGATEKGVLRHLKAYCKENEIELPKHVKTKVSRKKGGKIAEAVVNYMIGTDEPTLQGMYDAILPNVKGTKNAVDHTNMNFVSAYAIKNGISLAEASDAVSKMETIVTGEEVAE